MSGLLWSRPSEPVTLFVRGARVVDPASGIDAVRDIAVRQGVIAKVGDGLAVPRGARVVDGAGLLALPGFVDLHTHFRVPGREDEEDLGSASRAGAAGGYVALFGMANTDPVVDTAPVLQALVERAQVEAVMPCGFFAAVTRGLCGEQLTEMADLAAAGTVGFSDDGRPLTSSLLVRRALQYVRITDRFVAVHGQDDALMGSGVMHEGAVSARLGLAGIPGIAESVDVARALEIAAYEGARLHLCHVSAARSLDHLAAAREMGVRVSAEATPHHLTLTDSEIAALDSNHKMNPPLRPEADRAALVAAVRSGLVECIATDHAPHAAQEKEVPFEGAVFGTTGLETAFAAVYSACVLSGELELATVVERMSQGPARVAGIPEPAIRPGRPADFCLVDPAARWTVEPAAMQSRSSNSAWAGRTLTGRVVMTLAAGGSAWEVDG